MSKKYTLLIFKGICMNFLLELNFFILSHPVTSKQPHKIVQIHMRHPVDLWGISFHAVVVFGMDKDLLFKSVLGRCAHTQIFLKTSILLLM